MSTETYEGRTPKAIQRYEVRPGDGGNKWNTYGHEESTGEWVKYADHEAWVSKILAIASQMPVETTTAEAKQRLIDAAGEVPAENKSSLDEAAEVLLTRVSQFFGECVGGDTFCGLSIDETRDENGLLQSLRLVPCDLVNGEPVRRVGK